MTFAEKCTNWSNTVGVKRAAKEEKKRLARAERDYINVAMGIVEAAKKGEHDYKVSLYWRDEYLFFKFLQDDGFTPIPSEIVYPDGDKAKAWRIEW